ncbi:uncharacterized protein A4U43_C05F8840 [Asparagus officinalis]|uniref:Uncharacterized protein n=1 Tax=Asparagus officinalis TaxID=4686 RepID=A0A5P1EVR0_ASPOF|nr:uncharacterized protein A4U43_C05F8840 [Asparagus officinalis]
MQSKLKIKDTTFNPTPTKFSSSFNTTETMMLTKSLALKIAFFTESSTSQSSKKAVSFPRRTNFFSSELRPARAKSSFPLDQTLMRRRRVRLETRSVEGRGIMVAGHEPVMDRPAIVGDAGAEADGGAHDSLIFGDQYWRRKL